MISVRVLFGNHSLKHLIYTGNIKPRSPVFAKDRVIQDNFLQKFDELIGEVCSHEGLDCDRHLLWILSLRQGCLDNLQQRGTTNELNISNMNATFALAFITHLSVLCVTKLT